MLRHRRILPLVAMLLASLMALPANKNTSAADTEPPKTGNEHAFFLHVNIKAIRDSALFGEVKDSVAKAGGNDVWDKVLSDLKKDFGFNPLDLDSFTFHVEDFPKDDRPQVVLIFTSSKPFNKAEAFGLGKMKPDERGFYDKPGLIGTVHFPDDKIAVMFHRDLAQKYLDGYAKDRKAWPFTAELTKAANENTLFGVMNLKRFPDEAFRAKSTEEFATFQASERVIFTANLKGKELRVEGHAKFPAAAAADKAKETLQNWIDISIGEVARFMKDETHELSFMKPALMETRRALKEAKVEVSGSNLELTGQYKADFDIAKLIADTVKHAHETAPRIQTENNFRKCGVALHNVDSVYGIIPIHGIGPKFFLKKDEKPLLSWRVAILPYLAEEKLYKEFKLDKPWDSKHNKKLIEKMPKVFAPVPKTGGKEGKVGYTHMQMVIGPRAMQPPYLDITRIKDGTSNTIALVEATEPVIWTKPDDVMFPDKELPKDFRKKFGGQFHGGFIVAMWDGSVLFVSDKVSTATLSAALSPTDGLLLGDDWPNGPPRQR